MIKRCKYCGKLFDAKNNVHVQCGREECKRAYGKECNERVKQRHKEEYLNKLRRQQNLSADALRAKDLGVSYGYYIALFKIKDIINGKI